MATKAYQLIDLAGNHVTVQCGQEELKKRLKRGYRYANAPEETCSEPDERRDARFCPN